MDINRETIAQFREDFEKLNHAIELKYGVVISLGNISYNSKSFTSKITVSNNEAGIEDYDKVEFIALCGRYGFEEKDYMRKVVVKGSPQVFDLVGFKPSNRKYPIIGAIGGKKYKLPRDVVFV